MPGRPQTEILVNIQVIDDKGNVVNTTEQKLLGEKEYKEFMDRINSKKE